MKTMLDDPLLMTPNQTEWPPAVVRRLVERASAPAPIRLAPCEECRYAELFAQQPRARCTCPTSKMKGRVVFAGQPVCIWMTARDADDLTFARRTPVRKIKHDRCAKVRRPK